MGIQLHPEEEPAVGIQLHPEEDSLQHHLEEDSLQQEAPGRGSQHRHQELDSRLGRTVGEVAEDSHQHHLVLRGRKEEGREGRWKEGRGNASDAVCKTMHTTTTLLKPYRADCITIALRVS